MVRELVAYARWGNGALELRVRGESMTVRAGNALFSFEPRMVLVEAGYASRRDVSDARRRWVYVELREPLEPLEAPRVDVVGFRVLGLFEVRVVDLDFERFLSVTTPGSFLYDYYVLTTRALMLETNARRKVYYEETPYEKLLVHIV